MGMPWVKVPTNIRTHPRSVRLAAKLRDRRAYRYIVDLYLWCGESAPDGHIDPPDAELVLEEAAGWDGEPGAFTRAAVEAEVVTRAADGGLLVANWEDDNGAHVAKLARDRDRSRASRESLAGKKRPSRKGLTSVARPSQDDRATVAGERRGEERRGEEAKDSAGPQETGPAPAETAAAVPSPSAPGPEPVPKAPKPSRQDALWERMQAARLAAHPGLAPLAPPNRAKLQALLGAAIAQLSEAGVEAAWGAWLADPAGRQKDPPWAFQVFVTSENLDRYRSAAARRAATATGPPARPQPTLAFSCEVPGCGAGKPLGDPACERHLPAFVAWAKAAPPTPPGSTPKAEWLKSLGLAPVEGAPPKAAAGGGAS